VRITTKNQVTSLSLDLIEGRVSRMRSQLGCLGQERDAQGSDFWYLRLGTDELEIPHTRPIAIGFDDRLNDLTEAEVGTLLIEQEIGIYSHYINRTGAEQPVMYLLYPTSEESGQAVLVSPQEGGLKQRDVRIFKLGSGELATRLNRLKAVPIAQNILCSVPLVERVFYDPIQTAKELAQKLAESAREIERIIPESYALESKDGYLHQLLESFKRELLPDLKVKPDNDKEYSLADIYAQTVAYALFTARVFSHIKDKDKDKKTHFDRISAWRQLPETNPFLRKLFEDISNRSSEELGDKLISAISDIFVTLRAAKMETILQDFEQRTNQEDIVIRFYEDFLAAYKPKMRERRGVYYTPEPVVSYMVRSVDILLKDKFNKPLGLADPEVMILDPATGTGTFLLWICQLIHTRFHEEREAIIERVGDITWSEYVRDHLLPRIFGFELLMAPYAIAHLKLGLFLQETGYQFDEGKRLGVYLTNTLDEPTKKSELLVDEFIAEESSQAADIKKEKPIMVVIGNPPYSVSSANSSEWISNLIKDYKKNLTEKKINLDDDFIKFIRAAQWRIDSTGNGIVAFISSNTFLDGITHRRMRESLMDSFDDIWALNLHGSIKKKEKCPDGSKDENVFDIQQGVSINLFSRYSGINRESNVHHADVWGLRHDKYQQLRKSSISSTNWNKIFPRKENFFFVPKDFSLEHEYFSFISLPDIFNVFGSGVKTERDKVSIHFDNEGIQQSVQDFKSLDDMSLRSKYSLDKDSRDWTISNARADVLVNEDKNLYSSILYRPFDIRKTWYSGKTRGFIGTPGAKIMRHMLTQDNLGLITCRQQSQSTTWSLCGVSDCIAESSAISNKTKEFNSLFPLYIYSTPSIEKEVKITGFDKIHEHRKPNINYEFISKLEQNIGYTPTPEAIFYYIYAIFHSPAYRSRYAEFLKTDFPRVPLTRNVNLFRQLGELGEQLVNLQLMKSTILNETTSQFSNNGGGCIIDAGHPKHENGKVVINNQKDGFMDVPEAVWNFHIGSYQVCHKWLKDRKGRTLSQDDIEHYQKIVVALEQSIDLMAKIDEAIPPSNWPFV
jgi:predicted helicase